MIYTVTIEEHISQAFEVDAEDMDDAIKKAQVKYGNAEFIVEGGIPTSVLAQVECDNTGESTEWFDLY